MTQDQLENAWAQCDKPESGVWYYRDGKGKDVDVMTIAFDGKPERTFERRPSNPKWTEVPPLANSGSLK
ncbi:MAG: hypothetical protein JW395_1251 [Nitrospira sp.]|nr:hypothetical protein [Nitrospira sp.]